MVMNEYLDKKLRILNMHDEEPKICLMVTEKQKINMYNLNPSKTREGKFVWIRKQLLYILLILIKISQD